MERAIQIAPQLAAAHHDRGLILQSVGQLDAAAACYRQALAIVPDNAAAICSLGGVLRDLGRLDESLACYRRAVEMQPLLAEAHFNLGLAYRALDMLAEAVASYQRALDLRPAYPEALCNLGYALKLQGKLDEAIACYRRAVSLQPAFAEAHNNLGAAYHERGNLTEASEAYRRAMQCRPQFAEACNNLGAALKDQGALDTAVACHEQAVAWNPQYAEAQNALGVALKDRGQLREALACYLRALALRPDFASAHSNLLYTLQFCDDYDAAAICREHRRWNIEQAAPLARLVPPHGNDRTPGRRLRIGYVSPDFRDHCQAFFTLPLLAAHDHEQFEIFCYSDVVCPDNITERLRTQADQWRSIVGLNHEQADALIRQDRVDILVDLTMHMARGRALLLARKPAPVQVCWLAYPGTTGNWAIDYRLTDPQLDPPGTNEDCYTEESIRLADTFWCYDPLTTEPPVNALPALANGHITFGCLNNFCKVNDDVLSHWARVLRAIDRSRLLLLAPEGSCRVRPLRVLGEAGIAGDRITFATPRPRADYLALYHKIDIGLDTFPYNGHTTSLDSYWMGVPVITLVGPTVVGRAGASQLHNLGLPEFIARSPDEFVAVAAGLADELPKLSQLRATLRERLSRCPLMDAGRFARSIESAYREMWRRWTGLL